MARTFPGNGADYDDPYARIHPQLRPKFPFFGHRTLAEVAETEQLEALAARAVIPPYQMRRLLELRQRVGRSHLP